MNLATLADAQPTPWKNGGGTTRELLAWPSAHDWRVRVSVAEVEADGPFSAFPGVTRWFAVLSGAGVRLNVGGDAHALTTASPPFRFDGAAPVQCSLIEGPTQDFNLMLRGATGTLERVQGALQRQVAAPSLIAAWAGTAGATARFGHETVVLDPAGLAWHILETPMAVRLDADDALWMEVAL